MEPKHTSAKSVKVDLVQEMLNKVNGESIYSWDEMVREYGCDCTPDQLRKMAQGVKLAYEAGMMNDAPAADDEYRRSEELTRVRDERTATRKVLRDDARMRSKIDYLEELIMRNGSMRYEPLDRAPEPDAGGANMLICLSDLHIGLCYDNFVGRYNTEIARQRVFDYANSVVDIAAVNGVRDATVCLLGDMISGNIHQEITVTNRENVIEQVMAASELVTDFLYFMSGHFDRVEVHSVAGNHSRITRKEDALKDERLDDLIVWYAKSALRERKNVLFWHDADSTLAVFRAADMNVALVHGDYDVMSENGVNKLTAFLGMPVGLILTAHMHTGAADIGKTSVIRSGCLSGSGDPYTIQKRLNGQAEQTAVIAANGKVRSIHPVYLK